MPSIKYSIISLFSGAGFLDLGFTENGFRIKWGCELVPDFALSNNHNMRLRYGHSSIIENADILTVRSEDIPQAVGVIGGPPCQDFSIGNAKSPGITGDRGSLVWNYLEKILDVKPDFFVFENVEALYKVRKHRTEALLPLLVSFEDIGYLVQHRVLNALDYGIPQDRSRVFIVGFKKEIIHALNKAGSPGFSWPKPKYENAKRRFDWVSEWEFGYQVDERKFIDELPYPYELTVHSVIGDPVDLCKLPNHVSFRPYSAKFTQIPEGDSHRKSFKRLHRFKYSPTVAYGNNEVHLHPTEARRLTVREALRIQTVPDWYAFPEAMPIDKMFKMVSNGVPFKLASLIASEIKHVLDLYHSTKRNDRESIMIVKA